MAAKTVDEYIEINNIPKRYRSIVKEIWFEAINSSESFFDAVWKAAIKATEEKFTTTNTCSACSSKMPPFNCYECPVKVGCNTTINSQMCRNRRRRHFTHA